MSRSTKEKRKRQQLKKEAEAKHSNTVFDILLLLKTENLDTKPNAAKFLKTYVKCITGSPKSKPAFYPVFELDIVKYFVKFLDGHELIFNTMPHSKDLMYMMCYGLDSVDLDTKDILAVKDFFDKLILFNFIAMPKTAPHNKTSEDESLS